MPFIGLGLHIIIAIFFAIHAMKTGRSTYWLFILFSFPLLGSVVYFFVEYLPSSRVERGLKQVSSKAIQMLDPSRELREAKEAFELTPTIQNRMRLASALDNAGQYKEAADQFDLCLSGPFKDDPEVCFGAAKAKLHINEPQKSIELLIDLRTKNKEFRQEQLSVLLAQSYAAKGEKEHARNEFVYAYQTFGSAETRLEYGIWAAQNDDLNTAKEIKLNLDKDWKRWNKHSKEIHRHLFNQLTEAIQSNQQTE